MEAHEADGCEENPGRRGDGAGQSEAEHHYFAVRDPLQASRCRVHGAGPHRLAEEALAVEDVQPHDDDGGGPDDPQGLGRHGRPSDHERLLSRERRQSDCVASPDQHRGGLEHERGPHRGNDLREHPLVQQWSDGDPFEDDADEHHDDHRADEAGPERQPHPVQADGDHFPEHHQLPLGEIDDLRGVEDQREAHGRQRVHRSAGDPAEDVLQKLVESHD